MHLVRHRGFTIVEILVGVAIFVMIATALFTLYTRIAQSLSLARDKLTAASLANEQFEIIRNIPYADVGTTTGVPHGILPPTQSKTRDNRVFSIVTTVRNIDDPTDGVSPTDTAPADYKLVELTVSCAQCRYFGNRTFTSYVAPQSVTSTSQNGILAIHVINASGNPVPDAQVRIQNTSVTPSIDIQDTTDIDGWLRIIDAPPSAQKYHISATKTGYSTATTYPPNAPENPHPTKPDATVSSQQTTTISLAIDATSTINVATQTTTCSARPNVPFTLSGISLIGTSPDVRAYTASHTTDATGALHIPTLSWDTYSIALTSATYDIAGTIPTLPLVLQPGATQPLTILTKTKKPNSVLVVVKDATTDLPLSDATVTLTGPHSYTKSLTTSHGFFTQTDWSHGDGQDVFSDELRFATQGSLDTTTIPGELRLHQSSAYVGNGTLTSSTFDTGSSSTFHQLTILPIGQPLQTGQESVRAQFATNNDGVTWNFVGPDGTANSFYTPAQTTLHASHTGDRYARYKVFLTTADTAYTPIISDVSFTYTSVCTPPGQVYFEELESGQYTLTISKNGYTGVTRTVDTSSAWQTVPVALSAQ